ncbi:hypothetical protein JCM8547_007568 [Rhodosporidiobolus lusitaniae]
MVRATNGVSDVGKRFAALPTSPFPFDVLLTFPQSCRENREIWSSQAVLSQSPYFRTLFASGFAENAAVGPSVACPIAEPTFEDSDDETDTALPNPPPSFPSTSQLPPHKTVTITEADAASTRRLACLFPPANTSGPPSLTSPASFLAPVSPKSVYRLAHVLELPSLSSLALSDFRSQLTVDSALVELFHEATARHDELRATVLDFVLENAGRVFQTDAMKAAQERAKREDLEAWEGAVWAELAERLAGKLK